MRMAFGLVSLLVTLGVIVWIMHAFYLPYTKMVVDKGQTAQEQVLQISGKDENGVRVEDSIVYDGENRGDGRLADLRVTKLMPGGPMDSHFGVQVNDQILAAIDGHGVRTDINSMGDQKDAELAVRTAYSENGQLIVKRGDVVIQLPGGQPVAGPVPAAAVAPPVGTTPVGATPAAPGNNPAAAGSPQAQPARSTQPPPQNGDAAGGNDPLKDIRSRLRTVPGQ